MIIDRREALGIWKSRLGSGATYRALIGVFFKAGRLDYADAVCSLLKDSSDTRGRTNKIIDPGIGFASSLHHCIGVSSYATFVIV